MLIERGLTDNETKNLVHSCDCFVSLHRSEGIGRFLAEAMYMGKPVIATGWSGNMEFMNRDVACLVSYRLVPVREGDYPFWENQLWADPNVDEAAGWMVRLVDQPDWGRRLGERASRHIRSRFSYRAIGLQYVERLAQICGAPAPSTLKRPTESRLPRESAGGCDELLFRTLRALPGLCVADAVRRSRSVVQGPLLLRTLWFDPASARGGARSRGSVPSLARP